MTHTAPRRLLATIARALAPAGWMLGAPLPIQTVTTWHAGPHHAAPVPRRSRS